MRTSSAALSSYGEATKEKRKNTAIVTGASSRRSPSKDCEVRRGVAHGTPWETEVPRLLMQPPRGEG